MKVVTVVGARPQFIKAAVVSHALRDSGIEERIVHTGQHYDRNMSDVFFSELGIPEPHHNLGVGSGSHAIQTASMMTGFEDYLNASELPEWVLVYGDTNSTLAASMVASKMGIKLAHVEAGLRSMNMKMPEEINRIVTDRLSDLLFCPTQTAVDMLTKEGISRGVHLSGDVMLDATRFYAEKASTNAPLSSITQLEAGNYYLATVHRAENTDDPGRLSSIFDALSDLRAPVLLPLHPRTRAKLKGHTLADTIRIIDPISYLSMLTLITSCKKVLTDSGGLQKEAVWLGKSCITLRDETEWVETLENNWNQIVGADKTAILNACAMDPVGRPPAFGDAPSGTASSQIAKVLLDWKT